MSQDDEWVPLFFFFLSHLASSQSITFQEGAPMFYSAWVGQESLTQLPLLCHCLAKYLFLLWP